MKSKGWKDGAELIGVVAIVASLTFVGLEMRQVQDIPMSERAVDMLLAEIEARRPIYEFPDIWAHGNAGEELNRTEAVVCGALFRDINAYAYQRRYSVSLVDDQRAYVAASWDLTGYLYENPGAQRVWESLRDRYQQISRTS